MSYIYISFIATYSNSIQYTYNNLSSTVQCAILERLKNLKLSRYLKMFHYAIIYTFLLKYVVKMIFFLLLNVLT